jgi:hypothetical protein
MNVGNTKFFLVSCMGPICVMTPIKSIKHKYELLL